VQEGADLVAAYWRYHELSSGDRAARLASEDLFWAWETVEEAMTGEDPLELLDSLLAAPTADPCYLGAGPIEDLLVADPARWDEAMAERCRTSERWRAALACVLVMNQRDLKQLAAYVKPVK
jgi:hypothetical protein